MAASSVPPMYMPGRRRTGSSPSSTSMSLAEYFASAPPPRRENRSSMRELMTSLDNTYCMKCIAREANQNLGSQAEELPPPRPAVATKRIARSWAFTRKVCLVSGGQEDQAFIGWRNDDGAGAARARDPAGGAEPAWRRRGRVGRDKQRRDGGGRRRQLARHWFRWRPKPRRGAVRI